MRSLVTIMAVSGKRQHHDLCIVDGMFVHRIQRLFKNWFNSPFDSILCTCPCRACSNALSTRAKNSSRVISVGSAFRSATSFLAYRVRRFIRGSLSAMAPMLCQSSMFMELSCMAVISILWFYWLQIYIKILIYKPTSIKNINYRNKLSVIIGIYCLSCAAAQEPPIKIFCSFAVKAAWKNDNYQ